MSKNKNIKHQMLRLAKVIAEAEFSQEILREERIRNTLKAHPEFDPSEFKELVKDFQKKLHEKVVSIAKKEAIETELELTK